LEFKKVCVIVKYVKQVEQINNGGDHGNSSI
jgi:hypothetical protein